MASAAPVTEREQAMRALRHATRIRLARAAIRRRIATASSPRASRRLAAEFILEAPEPLQSARVFDVLTWCQRIGDNVARAHLAAAEIPETATIRALTHRQRSMLAATLRFARSNAS